MTISTLLAKLRGRNRTTEKAPVSEQALAEEALHAYDLLQKAEQAQDVSEAIPYLQQFSRLVRKSSPRDIYDPQAIPDVFAHHVMNLLKQQLVPPAEVSPEDALAQYFLSAARSPVSFSALEDQVEQAAYLLQEVGNGLIEPSEVASSILETMYVRLMKHLARTFVDGKGIPSGLDLPKVFSAYELIANRYCQNGGSACPTIRFTHNAVEVEQTTEKVMNMVFVKYHLVNLEQEIQENDPLKLNEEAEPFENTMQVVESYRTSCDLTPEEGKELDEKIAELRTRREEKVATAGDFTRKLEVKHDRLYERFQNADSLFKAALLFEHLMGLSIEYQQLLEFSNLDALVEQAQQKFSSLGATLKVDKERHLRIIGQDLTVYRTGIRPPSTV